MYTDDINTVTRVGAGVFSRNPRVEISIHLEIFASIFQTEVMAIKKGAR